MDSRDLSEDSIHELGVLFEAALREVAAEISVAELDGIERRLQAVGRAVLGQVVERVLALRAAHEGVERLPCPHCGGPMRRVDLARTRHIQGVVGDDTIRRAYDLCDVCRQGQASLDVRIGLGPGTLSPTLLRAVCRLGIEASCAEAMDAAREALGVRVPDETARRDTEGIGAVAEADQQADVGAAREGRALAATAPIDTRVLAVAVDGVQVPHRDGWHEMKVGTLAPLGPELQVTARARRTHLAWGAARYCAGLEEAEAFWWRVYAAACRRGLGTPAVRTVVLLGDGAEWIWHRAAQFLGVRGVEVVEIVDIYHAYEHLWAAGRAVFDTPDALTAWVEPLKDALDEEGAPAILAALDALVPSGPAAVDVRRRARAYCADNATRMDYPRYVAQQLPIGSGAVESLCKTLIEARAKGAGMRWTQAGAQAVATLRAVRASGDWVAFWATHPLRTRLRLCPPARPRRRATAVAPAPAEESQSLARPTPPTVEPPPLPSVTVDPAVPARRPAATHPWRRAPIERVRCA